MRITGTWLQRAETQAVFDALGQEDATLLFVGGCVRNALLGQPVADIDISTDLRPEDVLERAEAAGLRAVPTGLAHGTVTVISGGIPHEVTTFRKDIETDGRRAVVAFSRDIKEDAARRDFTMNALYADPSGEVIDPLGGLPDLRARRVRFIGDAQDRIREDYLRSLRFFRFHAWYGAAEDGLDPDALAAIAGNLDGLATLAKERVGAEMLKLLNAPDPAPSVAAMAQAGVLAALLPGADPRALAPLVHLETDLSLAPKAERRLAALAGQDVAHSLRLSKPLARYLDEVRTALEDGAEAGSLGFRYGVVLAKDILALRGAIMAQPVEATEIEAAHAGAAAECPVTAKDLMPDYQGAALGARLKELTERWVASGFRLTKADLLSKRD
ncbi:CCA tRNA nucleotidyltransferase [Thalassococcus sp. S3]|uniref:CCA tRNA nucleotidyltransferase n=1 Tax=Thalassococcus sp. S3 TaxID=2017482 RepID=UPI0010240E24|nr:CCA tRNA nucleotidyltransferase [Thalassococcus sp. S3]QBF34119.1 CCA tRNA nucleotidyltransferase [Thalassococcus sp. S3]